VERAPQPLHDRTLCKAEPPWWIHDQVTAEIR
jgi:hypothetical protein